MHRCGGATTKGEMLCTREIACEAPRLWLTSLDRRGQCAFSLVVLVIEGLVAFVSPPCSSTASMFHAH